MIQNDDLSLARAFLSALPASARDAVSPPGELEAALRRALRTAEAAWPEFALPPEAFAAYLSPRLSPRPGQHALAALGALHLADLYLACACTRRDPRALAAFEAHYFPHVERALARLRVAPSAAEDLKGALRERLFFPQGGAPPLLAKYSGRSAVGTWVHSVAVRDALKASRERRNAPSNDADLDDAALFDGDPELDYLTAAFAADFRVALAAAVAALSGRQRNLLRQHLLDGLSLDQLGKIYHVHRTTAARQIADARARLVRDVRQGLLARLRLSEAELESVLRQVRSRLDVSLHLLL